MIRPLAMSEIAQSLDSELIGADCEIKSVCIDSRVVQEGDLFVAIKGERFDGHSFLDGAADLGATGLLVSEEHASELPQIKVSDTREALGRVAALNRQLFDGKVVGITGGSGKTTAKNMLDSILSQAGNTLATKGNFNNEIGVPLTLLALEPVHQYAVVEMGARQIGDIKYLGQFVQPDVAILLNVGNAHIDIFGSYEQIVKAKSEIFHTIKEAGWVVFNADDPAADSWKEMTRDLKALSFSADGKEADVWAEVIEYQQEFCRFQLCTKTDSKQVTIPMPGHHNVLNSLAASAAAIALGLTLEQVKDGLESAANDSGRLRAIDLHNGTRLIDDSYNANPASVKAALDVLSLYEGKKIAAIGEMAELGDFAEKLHVQVAKHASGTDIDLFLLIGPFSEVMASEIGDRATVFKEKSDISDFLKQSLTGQETILIKGSRSAAMDEIVTQLKEAGQ